jgi:hypothetical protein
MVNMSTRTLSNGETFDVVTLPMGTVLFHGFHARFNDVISENKLFTELFGDYDDSGDFCVAPTAHKFFYPAPFMGDIVDKFQLYAIFILNYDVNLVSKVLPSKSVHRDKGGPTSATIQCDQLGAADQCGMSYKAADRCLTPLLLKEHPDIHGYIVIPHNDGSWFKTKFHKHLHEDYKNYVNMTTPMMVTNATGLSAIPEIVIHPYHVRSAEKHIVSSKAVHDPIQYMISKQSLLNFVPIVYFSESNTFSLLDLQEKKTRNSYLGVMRNNSGKAITPMHVRIKTFLDNALSPKGVLIHDMLFKMTIDLRTGFYIAKHAVVPYVGNNAIKNLKVWNSTSEDSKYNSIPFEYPEYMKKHLHGLLASKVPIDEESLSTILAKHKSSFNKVYIFDKGKSHIKFEMRNAFPFANRINVRNKTRKQPRVQKHTHSKTLKSKSISYNSDNE